MDTLKANVEALAKKATDAKTADEAMKFSQAALNAANAFGVLTNAEKHNK